MNKLRIIKEPSFFILERVNQFNHATRRFITSEAELIETLQAYPDLSEYEIEVDAELGAVIINALQK